MSEVLKIAGAQSIASSVQCMPAAAECLVVSFSLPWLPTRIAEVFLISTSQGRYAKTDHTSGIIFGSSVRYAQVQWSHK